MNYGIEHDGCPPTVLIVVNAVLACVDGAIAAVAFSQLLRIHFRNKQIGWTRQKVVHLLIGSSNIGYLIYFTSALVATCRRWLCWPHACGFVLMACPQILVLAAFLLLLSFWVDLCHQPNDEDEEDEDSGTREALLDKTKTKSGPLHVHNQWKCCPFYGIHVGSRQKFVILVTVLIFLLMLAFAVIIWIGKGKNPIDSAIVARVYLDLFAAAILLLGGALACYGLLLFSKMRKVRSEKAQSEMWKVAGLAVISVVCFTSCALVALVTSIPVLYHWQTKHTDVLSTSLLMILYYFIGSSVPSAFVLWVMRELPPPLAVNRQAQSRVVTYIRDMPAATLHPQPQRWTTATSLQNQASRASPI